MARTPCQRSDLLTRWKVLQDEQDDDDSSPSKQRRIRMLKEKWFSDSFKFLINQQADTHLWCSYSDLMGPLLETFHGYFMDKHYKSPQKVVWKRICQELGQCAQCICQHHQAQESYGIEYELETVDPLLKVLRFLDAERVTEHLQDINSRIVTGNYDPESHSAEVVSLIFEVFMFPILLDDKSLVNQFQIFIEAIDSSHELTLAGRHQYPGVYAMFFLQSGRARAIGLRLASCLGKLRKTQDLEPLQPLLRKYIIFLETEVLPPSPDAARPRVQLERTSIWLGVKTLLGFLEPPAFEEGILERYPVLLSIILNHVSDDTPEFSYAVTCLRVSFEMLGCKLWLRTSISPSMMRNTLLGQCFHTRDEKSHKEIFDIFLPFLQSLEALQDGEHEKQRRHFLYFLLYQVTYSSNFSMLTRKNACKIAILIVYRGYKMNPPCPPYECAHICRGPSLVCSLKDSSLHNSLRQPAFDLVEMIVVSDASALVSFNLKRLGLSSLASNTSNDFYDEELPLFEIEEKCDSCWDEFSVHSKVTSQECKGWICVPMLWFSVLVDVDPSSLPISILKAVFWALSHISIIHPECVDYVMALPDWLSLHAEEISLSLGWEVPHGSDDGDDGKECRNSIKLSSSLDTLSRVFKRFTAEFIFKTETCDLQKQWTWETGLAECLVLLLINPNESIRRVGRVVLEHISKTQGLTPGLQFLCSNASSMSALYAGLRFALRKVQADTSKTNVHNLQYIFFVICKLLKEVFPLKSCDSRFEDLKCMKYASDGGFLRQPCRDIFPSRCGNSPSTVDTKMWEKFIYLLSMSIWPLIVKCIEEGTELVMNMNNQMTCVRLLETLPWVFERLLLSTGKLSGSFDFKVPKVLDCKWICDLVDWGKTTLVVVCRHWKQCLHAVLNCFKILENNGVLNQFTIVEEILSKDAPALDDLKKKLSCFFISLSEDILVSSRKNLTAKSYSFDAEDVFLIPKLQHDDVIVLSDKDEKISGALSRNRSNNTPVDNLKVSDDSKKVAFSYLSKTTCSTPRKDLEHFSSKIFMEGIFSQRPNEVESSASSQKSYLNSKCVSSEKEIENLHIDLSTTDKVAELVKNESHGIPIGDPLSVQTSSISPKTKLDLGSEDANIKDLVSDVVDKQLEDDLDCMGCLRPVLGKPSVSVPKRKVIELQVPRSGKLDASSRIGTINRRFHPPKMDDWYRSILELEFFACVGLLSSDGDKNDVPCNLKEIPLCFESSNHYVEIFRPLVLEEFKAQLQNSYAETSFDDMYCGNISIFSVERIDDFHLVRCSVVNGHFASKVSENDLVIITKEPLQSSVNHLHALAKVERQDKCNKSHSTMLIIRFYFQNGSTRMNKMRSLLIERSKWSLSRVMSLTSYLREFHALSSLNDIPLLPVILNPMDHFFYYSKSRTSGLEKLPPPLHSVLKSLYNDNQLEAINLSIMHQESRTFDLSLIQGPPGTGKTRTIIAVVSALLAVKKLLRSCSANSPSYSSFSTRCAYMNQKIKVDQCVAIARAWQDAAFAKQLISDTREDFQGSIGRLGGGRILVCAQSNAAVDELVARISEGLYGDDGKEYKPYLVRVGNPKTIHPSSLPFFIDTLVGQRLTEDLAQQTCGKNDSILESSVSLRLKLEKVVDSIRFYESKRAKLEDHDVSLEVPEDSLSCKGAEALDMSEAAVNAKLKLLYEQKKAICQDLTAAQLREKKLSEETWSIKSKIRRTILQEAEIVVTTLSGCGGDLYAICSNSTSCHKHGNHYEQNLFDVVIIDEAAQALEPATLIPLQLLKFHGVKCIMVGDPRQLPATVLSNVASKFLYECSMFERLQRAGHPVIMLTEQYRMHPEIRKFPSLHFYDNKLLDGDHIMKKSASFHENTGLGPYMFFDVMDGCEQRGKSATSLSLRNEFEVEAAVKILMFLKKRYPDEFVSRKIGIITPYRSQLSLLRASFASAFGPDAVSTMDFNTVDGFQGREVDIVVLSTVRASEANARRPMMSSGGLGFVADVRRMNVALTRAKISLWIIGNSRTLQTNIHWNALIQNARERKLFTPVSKPYESIFRRHLSLGGKSSLPSPASGPSFRKESVSKKTGNSEVKCTVVSNEATYRGKMILSDKLPDKPTVENVHTGSGTLEESTSNCSFLVEDLFQKDGLSKIGEPSLSPIPKSDGKIDGKHLEDLNVIDSGKRSILNEMHIQDIKSYETSTDLKASIKKAKGPKKYCERPTSQGIGPSTLSSNLNIGLERARNTNSDSLDIKTKLLCAARKRQRADIDALLPSALISSKKPAASSFSLASRPPRSANTSSSSKPAKLDKSCGGS